MPSNNVTAQKIEVTIHLTDRTVHHIDVTVQK